MSDDTNRAGDEPGGDQEHNGCAADFPEAGKICSACGGKWVSFGAYVASRRCPFCGAFQARIIRRANLGVTPVTPLAGQSENRGVTIYTAQSDAEGAA